jgi:hypothetical protein
MTEPTPLVEREADADLEESMRQIENAGIPRAVIERAVRRAKIKTALKSPSRPPLPALRPKLDTNPELDAWYG